MLGRVGYGLCVVCCLVLKGLVCPIIGCLDKFCPAVVPTVMGILVVGAFIIGAISFKNIPFAAVSASPVSLFSNIFLFEGRILF